MGTVAITALYKATSMVGTVPITALYETASVVGTVVFSALYKAAFVVGTVVNTSLYKNSKYDQEIPQSQTTDNPMAPRRRATRQSRDTRKTKQPALSSPAR